MSVLDGCGAPDLAPARPHRQRVAAMPRPPGRRSSPRWPAAATAWPTDRAACRTGRRCTAEAWPGSKRSPPRTARGTTWPAPSARCSAPSAAATCVGQLQQQRASRNSSCTIRSAPATPLAARRLGTADRRGDASGGARRPAAAALTRIVDDLLWSLHPPAHPANEPQSPGQAAAGPDRPPAGVHGAQTRSPAEQQAVLVDSRPRTACRALAHRVGARGNPSKSCAGCAKRSSRPTTTARGGISAIRCSTCRRWTPCRPT